MIKSVLITLFLIKTAGLFGQTLSNFTYSDCLQECIGDSSKIQSIVKTNERTGISYDVLPFNLNLRGEHKLFPSGIN